MRAEIILKDRTVEVVMDEPDISVVPETVGPVINVLPGVGPQGPKGKDGDPGEKGDPGDDYILTEQDKDDIAELAAEKVVIPDVPVQDVQVNGVSVLSDGVANVPIAKRYNNNGGALGVVSIGQGLTLTATGMLFTDYATATSVKNGTTYYQPVTPVNQHASTFYGLAKAAGSDEKNSTLPVGQYTDEAKVAIRTMLGLDDQSIVDIVQAGLPAAEGVSW